MMFDDDPINDNDEPGPSDADEAEYRKWTYPEAPAASRNGKASSTTPSATSGGLPSIGSRELSTTEYFCDYIVEGVVPVAQPGLICGRFKTMKTSMSIDLAISMATATPFLRTFDVPNAVHVGIVTGESGWPTIQETARRVATARGIKLENIGDRMLRWSTDLPPLTNGRGLYDIDDFIERYELQVVIVDPTYLAMSGVGDKAANVFSMGAALQPLTDIGRRHGCSIVLVHHSVKHRPPDRQFEPMDLAEASQSGFAEWARWWLLLARREEYIDGTGEHRLWVRAGGSAGHSGLYGLDVAEGSRRPRRWDVTITGASEARDAARQAKETAKAKRQETAEFDARNRLWAEIQKHPKGEVEKTLRVAAGLKPAILGAALRLLLAEGKIEQTKIKRGNGHEYDGWKAVA